MVILIFLNLADCTYIPGSVPIVIIYVNTLASIYRYTLIGNDQQHNLLFCYQLTLYLLPNIKYIFKWAKTRPLFVHCFPLFSQCNDKYSINLTIWWCDWYSNLGLQDEGADLSTEPQNTVCCCYNLFTDIGNVGWDDYVSQFFTLE